MVLPSTLGAVQERSTSPEPVAVAVRSVGGGISSVTSATGVVTVTVDSLIGVVLSLNRTTTVYVVSGSRSVMVCV